jgi:hypothetical protein
MKMRTFHAAAYEAASQGNPEEILTPFFTFGWVMLDGCLQQQQQTSLPSLCRENIQANR